jgi:hypothetical protein
MSSSIPNVTFDYDSSRVVATFWSDVVGYSSEEVNTPGNDYWVTAVDRPTNPLWPHVFVEGDDYDVWVN